MVLAFIRCLHSSRWYRARACAHACTRRRKHTHPLTRTHAQVLLFQRLRAILTAAAGRRSSRVLTSAKASGRRPLARPTLFLSHPRETSLHRVRVGPLGIVPCRCSRPVLAGVACFRSHWTRVFLSARPPVSFPGSVISWHALIGLDPSPFECDRSDSGAVASALLELARSRRESSLAPAARL